VRGVAAQRGKRVVLIDHAAKLAEKIRISGGGRCNFTNINAGPANFLSENPHFCRSALSRYTAQDFLALVKKHRIAYHEKHRGQLFCDDSAEQIIRMLKDRVRCRRRPLAHAVQGDGRGERRGRRLPASPPTGRSSWPNVVVATGGLSIPKIGATDLGYRIAKQFGLNLIETRPGLVPLTFDGPSWQPFVPLAGIALEVEVETGSGKGRKAKRGHFREDLLFTHRGLSGPAILQISSYWQPGTPIVLNLLPEVDVAEELIEGKTTLKKQLGQYPVAMAAGAPGRRPADANGLAPDARLADMADAKLRKLGDAINRWAIVPTGSEGYKKAEVTLGGVDTSELSQQTMMANKVPGLYFIGESVDVTGWLGGYNFQWAWASGYVAGRQCHCIEINRRCCMKAH
jgi:predicted Rossmann fold flavoprotein